MANENTNAGFELAEGYGYVMDRSHAAACRLNLQFYLWKDALRFNIHPSVPVQERSSIADVGTGTAIWMIDVARQLPEAQIVGFDVDLTQAPHSQWLPHNVTLRSWDVFEDPPSDLIGKYDIVHVRLLVLVIPDGKPQSVLRNLFKLLKPGGYLQWDELDCVNMHVKRIDPSVSAPALEQLREMSYANGRYNWVLDLPQSIAEVGFEVIGSHHFEDGDELIRAFNEQHLLTMEEFALKLTRIGKKKEAVKFYELIRDGYQESIHGTGLCIPRVVYVAVKPA